VHVIEGVAMPGNATQYHLLINKATGLPARTYVSVTLKDRTSTLVTMDYSNIMLHADELPADTFAFTPPAKAVKYVRAAVQQVKPVVTTGPAALATGSVAPDFTVQDEAGNPVKLSNYAGKVVVLYFWSTWSDPCKEPLAKMATAFSDYQPKGSVVLPICTWDDQTAFKTWLANRKPSAMRVYFDPAGRSQNAIASSLYAVKSVPYAVVVGKDGKVAATVAGTQPYADQKLKSAIYIALTGPPGL
jgi:peroxiredoxin